MKPGLPMGEEGRVETVAADLRGGGTEGCSGVLKSNGRHLAAAARVFGVNHPAIFDILKKERKRGIKDR